MNGKPTVMNAITIFGDFDAKLKEDGMMGFTFTQEKKQKVFAIY